MPDTISFSSQLTIVSHGKDLLQMFGVERTKKMPKMELVCRTGTFFIAISARDMSLTFDSDSNEIVFSESATDSVSSSVNYLREPR